MYTQNKKKFYIIGSNPKDFFDTTIEGTEILLKSDVIIISKKYDKNFTNFFRENKKKYVYQEDLSKKKDLRLWSKMHSYFTKNNIISYLISGDPNFNSKNTIEDFFLKKRINVIKILGVLEIVNWVNKKYDFLTNREKNSSVFFYFASSLLEIKKIIKQNLSGKLIIIIEDVKLLNSFLIESKKDSKLKYNVYINGNRQKSKKMPFILESYFSNAYLTFYRE